MSQSDELIGQSKDVVEALGGWQRYTIIAICMLGITLFAIWQMAVVTTTIVDKAAAVADQSMRLVNAALAQCGSP